MVLGLTIAIGVPPKLFSQGSGLGQSQDVASSGTQFLLCFEQNNDPNLTGALDDGYLEIWFASLNDTATVTITCNHYPNLHQVLFIGSQRILRPALPIR